MTTIRPCTDEETSRFNVELSRMSTLGYLVSKGAQLGIDAEGNWALYDITNSKDAISGPMHEDIHASAKIRIRELGIKKGHRVTLLCGSCSERINGNDYAEGIVTGVFLSLQFYSGVIPFICLEVDGVEKNILLRDVQKQDPQSS